MSSYARGLGSMSELENHVGQGLLLSAETLDHCLHHIVRIEPLDRQRMPGGLSKQRQERELGTAVHLAKWMDGIELGKKVGRSRRERLNRQPLELLLAGERTEELGHLPVNAL